MSEQIKLSQSSYSRLKDTMSKLIGGNKEEDIKKFYTGLEVLKANAEQYDDAINAKNYLSQKKIADAVVEMVESAGLNVSRLSIQKAVKGLFEEDEKEGVEKEDNDDEGENKDSKSLASALKDEDEDEDDEKDSKKDDEEPKGETQEKVENALELSGEVQEKISQLSTEVNDLTLELKEKQVELAEEKKKNESLRRSIPKRILAITEAALPEIIEIAKQEIINGNSVIKMKCEAFDKMSEILGTDALAKKLTDTMKMNEVMKSMSLISKSRGSQETRKIEERVNGNRAEQMSQLAESIQALARVKLINESKELVRRPVTKPVVDNKVNEGVGDTKKKATIMSILENLKAKKMEEGKGKDGADVVRKQLKEIEEKKFSEKRVMPTTPVEPRSINEGMDSKAKEELSKIDEMLK